MFGNVFSQNIVSGEVNKSQIYLPLTNEQFFEQSEFIFEGRLIERSWKSYNVGYDIRSGKGFYTSSIIEVKHVYKGGDKIKIGTIEIITKGGSFVAKDESGIRQLYQHFPENRSVGSGTSSDAVFFCKASKYPKNPVPLERTFDNSVVVSHLVNRDAAVLTIGAGWRAGNDWKGRIIGLNNLNFANRAEFNQYLKQFKGLIIPTQNDKIL